MNAWRAAARQAQRIARAKSKRAKKEAAHECCALLRQALTGKRA